MNHELLIQNGSNTMIPVVEDGVEWQTEREGSPGEFRFTVRNDDDLSFTEGNAIRYRIDNTPVFFGYVFSKQRTKEDNIEVVAYDQIRYLKNKDTYVFQNRRADQIIHLIAGDFGLKVGSLKNTGYKIPSLLEDNTTLLDMITNALGLTLENRGEQYIFYDDFGSLTLKRIQDMATNVLVDIDTAEDFDYQSSIDSDTYNRVKLIRENEETGHRDVYISQDSKNINNWGVLQHFDTLEENENGKSKADALLQLYNHKERTLSITKQLGDLRVRAGSMVVVQLDLGDVTVSNMMLVEKCTHKFTKETHFMDLTLRGGEFSA